MLGMNWDTIVVLLVLALTLAYVIRRFSRARKGESCCGNSNCACSRGQGATFDRNGSHCCSGKTCKH